MDKAQTTDHWIVPENKGNFKYTEHKDPFKKQWADFSWRSLFLRKGHKFGGRCQCSPVPVQEEKSVSRQNSPQKISWDLLVRYQDCAKGGCIYHYIYSYSRPGSLSFHRYHLNFDQKVILIKPPFWNQNIRLNWYKWTHGYIKGTSNKSSTSAAT